jgi:YHS domain-containing protein
VRKLNSLLWVSAAAIALVAAAGCSTGEQQQAEPAAEHAEHMEMETAGEHAEHMEMGTAAAEKPMQVTDPVCGMTVTTASEHKAMHEGETYHFCSTRCVESFTENPEAYVKEEEPGTSSEG